MLTCRSFARAGFLYALVLLMPQITGCEEEPQYRISVDTRRVVTFGFLPYADRQRMKTLFDCLKGHLSQHLDAEIQFVLSPDFDMMGELMLDKKLDLVWFTPAAYAKVGRRVGARILCKPIRRGQPWYRSELVVGSGSTAQEIKDLKGSRFAYVDKNSTSGFVMPNRQLARAGFKDPLAFFSSVTFTNRHEDSLAGIAAGRFDAASVYEGAMEHVKPPLQPSDFRVLVTGPHIPNDPICVRPDLDPDLTEKIRRLFLQMHEMDSGREALVPIEKHEGITKFIPARDEEYDF